MFTPDLADLVFCDLNQIPALGARVTVALPEGLYDGVVEKYRLSHIAGQVEQRDRNIQAQNKHVEEPQMMIELGHLYDAEGTTSCERGRPVPVGCRQLEAGGPTVTYRRSQAAAGRGAARL